MTTTSNHSQYLFQVVPLFLQCEGNLKLTISRIHFSPGRYESLFRLQRSLVATEKLLRAYVFQILREHQDKGTFIASKNPARLHLLAEKRILDDDSSYNHGDILRALEYLEHLAAVREANRHQETEDESLLGCHAVPCLQNPQEATVRGRSFYATSAESQLLFRLVVVFQLLLVRIDDAHFVITGHRIEEEQKNLNELCNNYRMWNVLPSLGFYCLGAGMIAGFFGRNQMGNQLRTRWPSVSTVHNKQQLIRAAAKFGSSLLAFGLLKGFANVCWMSDKIIRSNNELLEWNHQWELIHCIAATSVDRHRNSSLSSSSIGPTPKSPCANESSKIGCDSSFLGMDEKSRALIEYTRNHGRKSYFCRSTGEIRFLMVKRFMDIYYASIGVGVHCTKDNAFFLPLVAGAAASFYAITGARTPTVVDDESSRDLIRHAWGMVSFPVLKDLMLQASRLIKGASVADRIILCGVPCFVLSKDPAPELAAVLQRKSKVRVGDSSGNLSQLSTIAETEILSSDDVNVTTKASQRKSFVGSKGQYRQRDVILHLTGGGFFAHTIASDLPYLLDWSSSTGSVVICPEYSLLPENQFPTQLDQIADIYATLTSGNTGAELGFDVNSIIVTGESAGGNLAAALCVKLALQTNTPAEIGSCDTYEKNTTGCSPPTISTPSRRSKVDPIEPSSIRMPDAIMLSCPALNLTTELSHSRVVGTEDPVLPNALISAISEAYLPPGCDNKHPLVSPFYADDKVLRNFPPTLLFASSKDPLLDDSVTFNERLRVLGVDSELMAVHNVPHAYLGLGTAGFPEAVQVQQYAMDWLSSKFSQ